MSNLTTLLSTLITASHVLHYNNVLDAYGHVSVRSPLNSSTFYLSHNVAPALIASPADLVEYQTSDASAVDPNAPSGYIERNIHAAILRQYSQVNCVIHSHSQEIVSYSTLPEGPTLRPVWHMAGFLGGSGSPLFDIEQYYGPNDPKDTLIRTPGLGSALSAYFSIPISNETKAFPDTVAVLMRGHGFTTAATDIESAVFQAIYAQGNARILTSAIGLSAAAGQDKASGVRYLTDQEAIDTWKGNQPTVSRPWGLWKREVEAVGRENGLYVNTLDDGSLTN